MAGRKTPRRNQKIDRANQFTGKSIYAVNIDSDRNAFFPRPLGGPQRGALIGAVNVKEATHANVFAPQFEVLEENIARPMREHGAFAALFIHQDDGKLVAATHFDQAADVDPFSPEILVREFSIWVIAHLTDVLGAQTETAANGKSSSHFPAPQLVYFL